MITPGPGATPDTIPVVAPTVAIEVLLLVQLPPGVVVASVFGVPKHTLVEPVNAAGIVFDVSCKAVLVAVPPPVAQVSFNLYHEVVGTEAV